MDKTSGGMKNVDYNKWEDAVSPSLLHFDHCSYGIGIGPVPRFRPNGRNGLILETQRTMPSTYFKNGKTRTHDQHTIATFTKSRPFGKTSYSPPHLKDVVFRFTASVVRVRFLFPRTFSWEKHPDELSIGYRVRPRPSTVFVRVQIIITFVSGVRSRTRNISTARGRRAVEFASNEIINNYSFTRRSYTHARTHETHGQRENSHCAKSLKK